MLDLVPNLLVGIEFRRMRRKKEQPNLRAMRPDELAHGGRPMKRDAIGNQDQGPGSPPQKLLEERHIPLAVNRLFGYRVAQFARGRDDGQDVIPPAPVGGGHHRRRADRAPQVRPTRVRRPTPASSSKPISAPIFSASF